MVFIISLDEIPYQILRHPLIFCKSDIQVVSNALNVLTVNVALAAKVKESEEISEVKVYFES